MQKAIKLTSEQPREKRMQQAFAKLRKRAQGYSEQEIMQIVDEAVEAGRLEEKKAS